MKRVNLDCFAFLLAAFLTPQISPCAQTPIPTGTPGVSVPKGQPTGAVATAARPLVVGASEKRSKAAASTALDARLRQFNLTLDLKGSTAYGSADLPGAGYALSLFGEWRAYDVISIGLEYAYGILPGTPSIKTNYLDLEGRIYPFKPKPKAKEEWYLMGGPGLNLNRKSAKFWPYRLHGNAGLGARFFLPGNKSLDCGLVWDVYNPLGSMQHLSLKVGFGWQFGKTCLEARSPDDPLDLKKMVAEEKAEKHKAVKNAPTGKK